MGSYIKGHRAMMKRKLKCTYSNSVKEVAERKMDVDDMVKNFQNELVYDPEWRQEIKQHSNWAQKVMSSEAKSPKLTNRILQ
jgi:glutaredoxin-related protein